MRFIRPFINKPALIGSVQARYLKKRIKVPGVVRSSRKIGAFLVFFEFLRGYKVEKALFAGAASRTAKCELAAVVTKYN